MSDKITVDELKMFVGTGLGLKDLSDNTDGVLWYVGGDEFGMTNPTIERWLINKAGDRFKPIVRPLSQFNKNITHRGETFLPITKFLCEEDLKSGHIIRNFMLKLNQGITYRCLAWCDLQKLSHLHFDCFRWLNKTGEDGMPLAVEKGS